MHFNWSETLSFLLSTPSFAHSFPSVVNNVSRLFIRFPRFFGTVDNAPPTPHLFSLNCLSIVSLWVREESLALSQRDRVEGPGKQSRKKGRREAKTNICTCSSAMLGMLRRSKVK